MALSAMYFLTVFLLLVCTAQGGLKLASYYNNHMVLQRGPQQAVLWGTADTEGDTVTARVMGQGHAVNATVQHGKWKLKLPAITDPGPFVINVISGDGHVTMRDVLFGDVWLCAGESNMELSLNQVLNSTREIERGQTMTSIRFTKVAHINSSSLQHDATTFYIPWTPPNRQYLPQVSSVCFLFAEYLQPHLNYPIGLVEAAWGGTTIEAWSPHEAVQSCQVPRYDRYLDCCPKEPEVLFNGMISPLTDMTIYGALWYQGESNENYDGVYGCQMEAMVTGWREEFHNRSLGQTARNFPFGYVQLATGNSGTLGGLPALRWAQTAGYGYSPNQALPDTFMAVAMDLKDVFHPPMGPYYPQDKQDVAERLVLGALSVGYGHSDVTFQGPFPSSFSKDREHHTLTIEYDQGRTPLDVRNTHGFEVCCSVMATGCDENGTWIDAPITGHDDSHVTVSYAGCYSRHVVGLRYAWRSQPCDFKQCAIYSAESGLPAPTYITQSPPA